MSSDDNYWEELMSNNVIELEKKRDKLYEEVSKLEKPDSNRMLAEKLRTPSHGCNCQRMVLAIIQDSEVKHYIHLSPFPTFLKEATSNLPGYSDVVASKVGEAYYKKRNHWVDGEEGDFVPELTNIKRYDKHLPTLFINGKHYYQDPCTYSDDAISEDIHWEPEFVQGLPDGIYHILVEVACYGGGGYYDDGGETELDYKVYPSVPLWEFLRHKEELIEEADPEAEELASRYLYIQETVQKRKKESLPDIDSDFGFSSIYHKEENRYDIGTPNPILMGQISPQQFVEGNWRDRTAAEENENGRHETN